MIQFFCFGVLFGVVLVSSIYITYLSYKSFNKYYKLLKHIIEVPISDFTFVSRYSDTVVINYNQYVIYLIMNKKEFYLYNNNNNEIIISKDDNNKYELSFLYNKLINGFNDEIFNNIITVGNYVISNNVVRDKIEKSETDVNIDLYDVEPSVNDILDKISKHGADSLTKKEQEILKRASEK